MTVTLTGTGPDINPALLAVLRRQVRVRPGAEFGPNPGGPAIPAGGVGTS